jgi:protease-4
MMSKNMCSVVLVWLGTFVLAGCGPSAILVQRVSGKRELKETEIGRDKGAFVSDKIAVIDVDGLMMNRESGGFLRGGENPVSLYVEKLDKARKDKKVKAVVLRLNSPGGTVGAADLMYHSLERFKDKSNKPVVACMLDVAASGAYYLACGSDGIVAQPSSITGSIGTIMQTMSFKGTMDKLGIKAVAIKSGELKDLASPLRDLSEEERELLQQIVTEFYEQFVEVVVEGRAGLQQERVRELGDGRVFTGQQALEAGLVDRIGYPSDAVKWAKKLAGVKKARVVMYHRPHGYRSNVYSSADGGTDLSGALINIELPDWLTAEGAQFLYLWQPGLGED